MYIVKETLTGDVGKIAFKRENHMNVHLTKIINTQPINCYKLLHPTNMRHMYLKNEK